MFADQIAIVTGGESGIGAACAKALAAGGARIAITFFKDEAAARAVCSALGGDERAIAVKTDVGDEASVSALFAACMVAFGPPAPATAALSLPSAPRRPLRRHRSGSLRISSTCNLLD